VTRRRRLRDYYRQFEELGPEEVSAGYRERSREARSRALAVVPPLDLTSTAWHEPPHPEVVNAATFALRRAVSAYPDPSAEAARIAIAARHGLPPERIVLGHGAGELLATAFAALSGPIPLPWPNWAALPALIARGGGEPIAVDLKGYAVDLGALDGAVGPQTRAVILSSPADPTGLPIPLAELAAFARGLPERVVLLVDEASAEFLPDEASALELLADHPRLVVVRTFAKAYAMAGFRVGWAAGGASTGELLAAMAPNGAVGAAAQAAAVAAIEQAERVLPARRVAAAADRDRLAAALAGTPFGFPAGASANAAWLRSTEHDGRAVAAHLAGDKIFVQPGTVYNDDFHVRASLRGPEAVERLVAALAGLP
jgi:histidinol-phosphate aminotransferase